MHGKTPAVSASVVITGDSEDRSMKRGNDDSDAGAHDRDSNCSDDANNTDGGDKDGGDDEMMV